MLTNHAGLSISALVAGSDAGVALGCAVELGAAAVSALELPRA